MEGRARRRRVPAFGEWNYNYHSGELATPPAVPAVEWCAEAELEASSDVWFKYSPPPRRPPPPSGRRKVRRPATEEMDGRSYGGGGGKRGLRHHRAPTTSASSDTVAPPSVAHRPAGKGTAGAGAARARVVRPVDADLYQMPPPEFLPGDDEPRRRVREEKRKKKASRRSLWTGCFGFNCVPAE
ncbi:uncharacterized protein LOC120699296 isoform X2 [Panicum virgatum]|uniref:Uncharacterized protein n=1 Tax=Panicum virgatum TaxID=38727 RepID=A0A8T0V354_PANVG|nr:uncharacterized protein LOC120699296 isoform X2 [Panicum virgatum]KAG2628858.1 hypothetical protein PVAP13_3KG419000 [Panicum virgatum]